MVRVAARTINRHGAPRRVQAVHGGQIGACPNASRAIEKAIAPFQSRPRLPLDRLLVMSAEDDLGYLGARIGLEYPIDGITSLTSQAPKAIANPLSFRPDCNVETIMYNCPES